MFQSPFLQKYPIDIQGSVEGIELPNRRLEIPIE
jgi:hypothetical protein